MPTTAPPRRRLLDAAARLLAERPDVTPTTRELCEAAGVGAPTLYHHFGDKDGLVDAVLDDAFAAYLQRKQAVRRSADLVADLAAGWDMHVRFGLENPVLYLAMYGPARPRRARAAQVAEAALLEDMQRLADHGLLRVPPRRAVEVTQATAVGCVLQLLRTGGPADGAVARTMRDGLVATLTGLPAGGPPRPDAARRLLATLADGAEPLQPAEAALLRQWLTTLADHHDPATGGE